jgi:hypothetical protein
VEVKVMAERALPFVNVALWSGGYYSTATKGAKDAIDGARACPVSGFSGLTLNDDEFSRYWWFVWCSYPDM